MITPASRCSCWNQIMPPLLQQKVKKSHTQFDNRIKYAPLSNHFSSWFFSFLFCLPLGIVPNYQNQRLYYQDYANIFRINNALFIFTVHSDCCFHTCALFFAGITFFIGSPQGPSYSTLHTGLYRFMRKTQPVQRIAHFDTMEGSRNSNLHFST